MKFLSNILASWKPAFAGIASVAGGVAAGASALADGYQTADWAVLVAAYAAITNGLGNIFSKQNNVSNAQVPMSTPEAVTK